MTASTTVMESLSGLTAATMDPSGETATADEETAPARGGGAVEVGDGVGVGVTAGAGVGVGTAVGPEVGGGDVPVGVDVAGGPAHAASISPTADKNRKEVRPEGIRIIS